MIETVHKKFLPQIKKTIDVKYKDGINLELNEERVMFEVENFLDKSKDLLEFNIKITISGQKISIQELKNLLNQNKKIFQLESGKTVTITNIREITKWMEFLSNFDFNQRAKGKFKGKSVLALELDEFLEQNLPDFNFTDEVSEFTSLGVKLVNTCLESELREADIRSFVAEINSKMENLVIQQIKQSKKLEE